MERVLVMSKNEVKRLAKETNMKCPTIENEPHKIEAEASIRITKRALFRLMVSGFLGGLGFSSLALICLLVFFQSKTILTINKMLVITTVTTVLQVLITVWIWVDSRLAQVKTSTGLSSTG
jgi:hypothetical protein